MKNLYRIVAFIVICLWLQSMLIKWYKSYEDGSSDCVEYSIENDTTSLVSITHQRQWKEPFRSSRYCMDYTYYREPVDQSASFRNKVGLPGADNYTSYWGNLYGSLYRFDSARLITIEDSLNQIAMEKELNRAELAHMVVKFVQDIPYSYIMSEPCEATKNGKPCRGDSRFGILSPLEFLYSLQGDCDTRTVLLYGILRNLGYDPLILISNEYLHSMLALNIPAAGDYLTHRGKKYYFWETTNTGWEPGMLAPDMQNKTYWDIALD